MLLGWFSHAESVFKAHNCDESSLDLTASHYEFKNWFWRSNILLCSTVVSLWFHLLLVHICSFSVFLGFLWNALWPQWFFWASAGVILLWEFWVLHLLTWVRVLALTVGTCTHSFISILCFISALQSPLRVHRDNIYVRHSNLMLEVGTGVDQMADSWELRVCFYCDAIRAWPSSCPAPCRTAALSHSQALRACLCLWSVSSVHLLYLNFSVLVFLKRFWMWVVSVLTVSVQSSHLMNSTAINECT